MEERRAAALDPLAPILRQNIGDDLHWLNRNAEAAIEYRAALTLDPNFVFALNGLCIAEADLGNLDTAKEILHNRLIAVDGEDGSATGSCRAAIALRGDDVQELKRLSSVASRQYANGDVPASSVALIYLYAGDLDEGLHWLAMAYNERDSYIFFTLTDPDLPAKLKADPRWKAFMQRPLMKEWQAAHDRAAAALAAETGAGGSGSH
jgi:tetratricopeptide (TPR) repeat protein